MFTEPWAYLNLLEELLEETTRGRQLDAESRCARSCVSVSAWSNCERFSVDKCACPPGLGRCERRSGVRARPSRHAAITRCSQVNCSCCAGFLGRRRGHKGGT